MTNPKYVEQLNALKDKLLSQKSERITKTTNAINSQYDKQIAFVDKVIQKNS